MSNGLAEAFHLDAPDAADAPHSDTIDDFSARLLWEQRAITRERLADAERHWAAALDGELPVLQVLLDRPRPVAPTYRGGICSEVLDAETTAALEVLGRPLRRHCCSPKVPTLAA